jgi:small subunit ribosomal protein S9
MAKSNDYFTGLGRRKTAVAQTRIMSGNGTLKVNGEPRPLTQKVIHILELVGRTGQIDTEVILRGGGMSSQEDAVALGVARALVNLNPDFRSTLRKAGYLTRDARIKERKKPGLKKARRAPQWAKR